MNRSLVCAFILAASACNAFGTDEPAATAPVSAVSADAGSDGPSPVNGVPGEADFSVSVAAGVTTVVQGVSAKFRVTIVRGSQLDGGVALSVTGLRAGLTVKTVTANGATADLEISASPDAVQGDAAGMLEAKAGAISHSVAFKALVRGKPGAVDTTYGVDGNVSTLFGAKVRGTAIDLVVAPDDSVYAVGNADDSNLATRVVHLDPGGKVDAAYGTSGRATINIFAPHSALLQPDGKLLLVGGNQPSNAAVGRLTTSGAPDPGFGNGTIGLGTQTLATGSLSGTNNGVTLAALRKDGDIFLAWDNADNGVTKNATMELAPNGQIRTAYAAGGAQRTAVGLTTGLAVRNDGTASDGKLAMFYVDSGTVYLQQTNTLTLGYDPLFGGPKSVALPGLTRSAAGPQGLVVLSDGSIVGAFRASDGVYFLKFTKVGAPGPGFGTGGVAGPYASPTGEPTGIAVQSDGKILVSYDTGGLTRLTAAGLPDDEFGDHGTVPATAPTTSARRSVVQQKSGRILVSGERGASLIDGSITAYWP